MVDKIDIALREMAAIIESNRVELIRENAIDIKNCDPSDKSLFDRLIVNDKKVDNMIEVLHQLAAKASPLGKELYSFTHENGIQVTNKTVAFGSILIIYESRPDVTVEATATALKSGNKILLKGGKEARNSNLLLHKYWLEALDNAGLPENWVRFLDMDRVSLQQFLKTPDAPIDLIIPRGGERLIEYVKSVAQCPVLVSGRGNNFLYVSATADLAMAKNIIIESKVSKISACNALDKVLIDDKVEESFVQNLKQDLQNQQVEIIESPSTEVWMEEFLDYKIVIERVSDLDSAIEMINAYAGGHSATIVTTDQHEADVFTDCVDCAAVYHNASTRFTDGFEFGLGAEMAISTQKLHHRGPLGIEQLVTNKWTIKGNGQVR